MLTRPSASFELARQLQINAATLGDVYTFCSGLYFRGKLAYALRFAQPPSGFLGSYVITPSQGLLPHDTLIGLRMMKEFASVDIAHGDARFLKPLRASLELISRLPGHFILLGSIATAKYVDCLLPVLGERLLFPADFVGRGDMSRGALLLRAAKESRELEYIPVLGAKRNGRRAPSILNGLGRPVVRG